MRTAKAMIAAVAGLALVAVACGGDGAEPDAQPTAAVTATPPVSPPIPEDVEDDGVEGTTELTLAAEGIEFDRQQLSAEPGATVELTLENNDSVPHNFALYATGQAQEEIFIGETFSGPDESMTYEFDAPDEFGTYFFRCDVHPTTMTGSFVVG